MRKVKDGVGTAIGGGSTLVMERVRALAETRAGEDGELDAIVSAPFRAERADDGL